MKIKMIEDGKDYKKDTVIDCDDITAKTFIDAKQAVELTEEIEKKDAEKTQEIIDSEVAKKTKETKEVKKMSDEKKLEATPDIEVTKNAPLWKSMGEFLGAVISAGKGVRADERLMVKSTGQNETTPADGGYTVTTDLAKYITQQASMASVMEQKCSHLEIGPNYTGIKIPQLNESTRSVTTLYGGVRVYSPAEGVGKTPFKQAYTQKDIQLKKLCAVNYLTDELMQDNTALEGFIRMNVGKAFAWTKDNEILNATLGAATAIKNNAATAETTFAGAYPTAQEVATMFVMNLNRSRAEWYMSGDQYAHLIALNTTGVVPLVQPNFNVSPAGTLFGRPINVIEQASTSSDETAFMFLDLTDYLVIGKGGIQEAQSIHVKFLEDETCLRWSTRFGGSPLMASTVTLPDGLVYSSFVTRD